MKRRKKNKKETKLTLKQLEKYLRNIFKHSDGVVPNSDENCLDIKDGGE